MIKIKEVVVVEGKNDAARVKAAIQVECLITQGLKMGRDLWGLLEKIIQEKGIIVLTDPDSPGEYIRREISKRFPQVKHAFIAKKDALSKKKVGIECASLESIVCALQQAHCVMESSKEEFSLQDLLDNGLLGCEKASFKRCKISEFLKIGNVNAKQFLKRLNSYGIKRSEFDLALKEVNRLF